MATIPIIQALDRALKILDLFDEYNQQLKITEISERMNLHKSTVHSLLKTLQLHGYIEQDADSGKYRLGFKLVEKGQLLLQSLDIREIVRKYLIELSAETGQTTHLVILDGNEGVYVDKVEGIKAAIRYSRIGKRVPIHSSAVGKVLSAFKSRSSLERMLADYQFVPRTHATITDKETFLSELDQVKINGYAVDDEENEQGVRCAAAPIYDHNGQVVAAMSISTMVSAVDMDEFQRYIKKLTEITLAISRQIGYR